MKNTDSRASDNEEGLTVKLTKTIVSDINEMLRIQTEARLSNWNGADYENEINQPESLCLSAKSGNAIVGFTVARLIMAANLASNNFNIKYDSEIEIYNIAVEKKLQKQGIGRLLVQELVDIGRKNNVSSIWLEVRESNFTAINFYKKNKFEEIYQRKNYYTNPQEAALVMKLDLIKKTGEITKRRNLIRRDL